MKPVQTVWVRRRTTLRQIVRYRLFLVFSRLTFWCDRLAERYADQYIGVIEPPTGPAKPITLDGGCTFVEAPTDEEVIDIYLADILNPKRST